MTAKKAADALRDAQPFGEPQRSRRRAQPVNGHSEEARALNGFELDAPADAVPIGETEDELAQVFALRAAPMLRRSPGLGWMHYDGRIWQRDESLIAYDLSRDVCREAAARHDRARVRLGSARTRNGVLALAEADPRLGVPVADWDREPFELNTPTGIVDLRTGSMRPRVATDYVTMCTSVGPDPFGDCPRFKSFLAEVFPGDDGEGDVQMIEFVQRWLGYCLTADTREQVLAFALGTGSNGKSVLTDLTESLWGTYAVKLPSATLMQARGERHPTGLAMLRAKRLAISSELEEGQHFAESLVKELTGDATLSARYMRQDFFTFRLTQKHLIVGNTRPRLHGGDAAMARRVLLVPFNAKFSGSRIDKSLLAKLRAEGPAILQWAIRGAALWYASGLAVPDSVRAASADYMEEHDDIRNWIAERCERTGRMRAQPAYESFALWKRERGENAPSATVFGNRITQIEGIAKRKSNGVWYEGISLTPSASERIAEAAYRARFRDE
ncbi:phage/plasmid primase, P4 family [Variovorax sp. Sphag1AA]|uniref:phage/plasmid primase, P4 family n=1 Tax=Variovorax sp. Sphag1AA TaxID=2587027 RepID=UPI0016230E78|nr:phage/plasmid primase, P4 family [Variovorax sp. Sphag1AA]MBB3180093.1 putative DNA primase/helicase [Variovorax sp. Sphag1AA]